jgi:hypothetical protein
MVQQEVTVDNLVVELFLVVKEVDLVEVVV